MSETMQMINIINENCMKKKMSEITSLVRKQKKKNLIIQFILTIIIETSLIALLQIIK